MFDRSKAQIPESVLDVAEALDNTADDVAVALGDGPDFSDAAVLLAHKNDLFAIFNAVKGARDEGPEAMGLLFTRLAAAYMGDNEGSLEPGD